MQDLDFRIGLVRDYVKLDLLDRNAEYEVIPFLIGWQDKSNVFYHVEADFTISEWRAATTSYTNNGDGSVHLRNQLFRGPHYDGVGKPIELFDEAEGIWVEGGDRYFAKRSDAIFLAEERIAQEQERLRRMIEELGQKEIA